MCVFSTSLGSKTHVSLADYLPPPGTPQGILGSSDGYLHSGMVISDHLCPGGFKHPKEHCGTVTFDQSAILERERMQLAGNCSLLKDNLFAMEKQCHPTPFCLRCVPDIQTL